MITDEAIPTVRRKYRTLSNIMDERVLRLWAASEALALGWGGITAVAEATGLSQTTIRAGIAEFRSPQAHPEALDHERHIRSPGAGRKRLAQEDRTLLEDLETLVDPSTRGDPQSPLLWTCKGTRKQGLRTSLGCLGAPEMSDSPLLSSPSGRISNGFCTIDPQENPISSGTSTP
jgi:hypothetical protein